jgi:hypothetical protein
MIPVSYYLSIPIEFKDNLHQALQHFDCVFLTDDVSRHPLVYSAIYQLFEKRKIYIYPNFIFSENNLFLTISNMFEKLLVDYHSYDAIYCLNQDGTLWPASKVLPQLDAMLHTTEPAIKLSTNTHSLFSANGTQYRKTDKAREIVIERLVHPHT